MHIQDFKQKLKEAFFVTLGWLVLSSLYAIYYIVSNLATPGDTYAMTSDFQLLMFFIFRVPCLVLILLVLIAVVFVLPPRDFALDRVSTGSGSDLVQLSESDTDH